MNTAKSVKMEVAGRYIVKISDGLQECRGRVCDIKHLARQHALPVMLNLEHRLFAL
jgi:hypothetical protein